MQRRRQEARSRRRRSCSPPTSATLEEKLFATPRRERRMEDGSRMSIGAIRSNCSSSPTRAGCRTSFRSATDGCCSRPSRSIAARPASWRPIWRPRRNRASGVLNFGGFATPERHVVFDINDLDETLPAPWEWDLKRLTASVVIAGQYLRLPEVDSARAARATARSYRERMANYSSMRALEVWYDSIGVEAFVDAMPTGELRERVKARVKKAEERSAPEFVLPKLVEHRGAGPQIKDDPPLIFHPTARLAPGVKTGYHEQVALYRATLPEHVRVLLDRYRLRDVAVKVVGVGSVGTVCFIALFTATDDDPLFLQIKEANASVLEPYAGKSLHDNHG